MKVDFSPNQIFQFKDFLLLEYKMNSGYFLSETTHTKLGHALLTALDKISYPVFSRKPTSGDQRDN